MIGPVPAEIEGLKYVRRLAGFREEIIPLCFESIERRTIRYEIKFAKRWMHGRDGAGFLDGWPLERRQRAGGSGHHGPARSRWRGGPAVSGFPSDGVTGKR